jgi:membrane associated rhomboid family serine protease
MQLRYLFQSSCCVMLCRAVQWVTHAFCHANWGHLSMNLFNLCVFGKVSQQRGAGLSVVGK